MTSVIINDVLPLTQLIAASGQTVFTTNWTADADSDVKVYARATGVAADDATQLVSSSLYTVGYTGAQEIVFITFLSGRTLSDVITITRVTPVDRENLYINTNFTPSMLNQDFGLFTLQIQENDLYNRQLTPRYNTSATIVPVVDIILPILGANQIWAKNNANNEIIPVNIPTAGFAPADATYVTLSDQTSVLPNSLHLNSLAQGFLVNLPGTPTLVARSILGTSNEITIVNGTGLGGNLTVSIPDNPIFPGTAGMGIPSGTTGQRVIPVSNINLRFNTTDVQLEYWDGGTWQQIAEGGSVVALTAGAGILLTPDPIIETGSIALAPIADHTLLANISGGALAPSSTTLTALIDNAIGNTRGDILYRNASAWVVLAPGTTGQLLQTKGAAANPAYTTAVYPDTTTANQLLYSSATNVIGGVIGANSASLVTSLTGVPTWLGPLTSGQLIIGSTGAIPVAASLTAGTGVIITPGAGSITITSTGGGLTWSEVTTTPQTIAINNGYISNRGGGIAFALPVTSAVGDIFSIIGKAGIWSITQAAGQQINVGATANTSGATGTCTAAAATDSATFVCITANTIWQVVGGPQSAGLILA